jgi:hypothetical protein
VTRSSPSRGPCSRGSSSDGLPSAVTMSARRVVAMAAVIGDEHGGRQRINAGPYSARLPLPCHHHGAKEPVRTLRSAATPAATSTTTIKIISSILIPVSPGVRICSEEASGLSGGGDLKRSSCPYEASLLRRDFPLVGYHDFRLNARRYFENKPVPIETAARGLVAPYGLSASSAGGQTP